MAGKRVSRHRWLYGLEVLAAQAPSRRQGYYARLRRLKRLMADDGFVSKPADQLRRAMGSRLPLRTAVATLAYAVEHDLLHRQTWGGDGHRAVYVATLPAEVTEPKTEPVMRLDPRTGERLPNGRRARQDQYATNGVTAQVTAPNGAQGATLAGSRSVRSEPHDQYAPECAPLVREETEHGGHSASRTRQSVPTGYASRPLASGSPGRASRISNPIPELPIPDHSQETGPRTGSDGSRSGPAPPAPAHPGPPPRPGTVARSITDPGSWERTA